MPSSGATPVHRVLLWGLPVRLAKNMLLRLLIPSRGPKLVIVMVLSQPAADLRIVNTVTCRTSSCLLMVYSKTDAHTAALFTSTASVFERMHVNSGSSLP